MTHDIPTHNGQPKTWPLEIAVGDQIKFDGRCHGRVSSVHHNGEGKLTATQIDGCKTPTCACVTSTDTTHQN